MTATTVPRTATWTAIEASGATGVGYSTLNYWDRIDFIRPSITPASGSGSRRAYDASDLAELVVARILRETMTLEWCRRSWPTIRPAIRVGGTILVVCGRTVTATHTRAELIEAIGGPSTLLRTVIDVDTITATLPGCWP